MSILPAYIDYYVGAYGKTIRIATESKHWVLLLKENIMKVRDNNIDALDVCKLPNTRHSDAIHELKLTKVSYSPMPCITTNPRNKAYFSWEQDAEEIVTLIGLIDGLLDGDSPGHQYLVYEDDGYIVELSYKEGMSGGRT